MSTADPARSGGVCFGFEIHSDLDLRFLRSGQGERLDVVVGAVEETDTDVLLRDWFPQPGSDLRIRILQRSEGVFVIDVSDTGTFLVDTVGMRVEIPSSGSAVRREERLLGLPLVFCFAARGDVPLHAAAVEVRGSAILLAAPGRFGKTTLAAGVARRGGRVLTEDLSCLRIRERVALLPGPAMLRLRHDVAERMSVEGDLVLLDADRVHYALHDPGDGEALPVRGVVLLHEGDLHLDRADPVTALRDMFALSFRLADDASQERRFSDLALVADRVPIWNMWRPLTMEALDEVVDLIEDAVAA